MRFETEYTFADYLETLRISGSVALANDMLGWLLTIAIVATLPGFSPPVAPGAVLTGGQALLVLLPWLIFPAILLVTIFSFLRSLRQLRRMKQRGQAMMIAGWIAAFIAFGLFLLVAIQAPPTVRSQGMVSAIPLLIMILVIIVAQFWFLRSYRRRMWNGSGHLHRRKTIEINETGMTVSDPLSRHEDAWASFIRWREFKNLFVVYMSKFSWIMLPKRALNGGESDVNQLRNVLQNHIHERTGAFPVEPIPNIALIEHQND